MDINEYKLLLNLNEIVIIYIYSKSFTELNKKINKLKKSYDYIFFLDIIEHKNIIEILNIKSAPLFIIYKRGVLIEEIFGNYKNIENILKLHMN